MPSEWTGETARRLEEHHNQDEDGFCIMCGDSDSWPCASRAALAEIQRLEEIAAYQFDQFAAEQKERLRAEAEIQRLRAIIRENCTCGSGGHPRRCAKHPERYAQHVAEINRGNLEEENAALRAELADHKKWAEGMVAEVARLQNIEAERDRLRRTGKALLKDISTGHPKAEPEAWQRFRAALRRGGRS